LSHPIRPTTKELFSRLKEASTLLSAKDGLFADHGKIAGELNALHMGDSSEVWDLIRSLLKEIKPEHYAGSRPPQKAYERSIEGRELFAFSWDSQHLGRRMYLKFAIKGDCYVYVSLHRDRPPQKGPHQ
jgi:hypothetical protein